MKLPGHAEKDWFMMEVPLVVNLPLWCPKDASHHSPPTSELEISHGILSVLEGLQYIKFSHVQLTPLQLG